MALSEPYGLIDDQIRESLRYLFSSDVVSTSDNKYFGNTGNVASIAAVPEPETYALMLAGIGMVGFMAKRRRR